MLGFGPNRTKKPRQFEYRPRYYDSTRDDRIKQRIRIESHRRRGKQPAFIALAILLMIAIVVYLNL